MEASLFPPIFIPRQILYTPTRDGVPGGGGGPPPRLRFSQIQAQGSGAWAGGGADRGLPPWPRNCPIFRPIFKEPEERGDCLVWMFVIYNLATPIVAL